MNHLTRDMVVICGTDTSYRAATGEAPNGAAWRPGRGPYQHCRVIRRDLLTDDDIRGWAELTLRGESVGMLDESDALREQVESMMFRSTSNRRLAELRGPAMAKHLLQNLHLLAERPLIQGGRVNSRDATAVIVGQGPSLSQHIDRLNKERLGFTIAVNGASKLVRHDLAITLECNDLGHKLAPEGSLCHAISAYPEMLADRRLFPIWTGELGKHLEPLTGVPVLQSSGSGTTAAVDLCKRLGFKRIILVGQDLALTDGRIYADRGKVDISGTEATMQWEASDTPWRAEPLPATLGVIERPSWYQTGTVHTTHAMGTVAEWLTSWARKNGEGMYLANCTEGGQHIPGWHHVPLSHWAESKPATMSMAIPLPLERVRQYLDWLLLTSHEPTNPITDAITAPYTIAAMDAWRASNGKADRAELRSMLQYQRNEAASAIKAALDALPPAASAPLTWHECLVRSMATDSPQGAEPADKLDQGVEP